MGQSGLLGHSWESSSWSEESSLSEVSKRVVLIALLAASAPLIGRLCLSRFFDWQPLYKVRTSFKTLLISLILLLIFGALLTNQRNGILHSSGLSGKIIEYLTGRAGQSSHVTPFDGSQELLRTMPNLFPPRSASIEADL